MELSLWQRAIYVHAPFLVYEKPAGVAQRLAGFRLISVTHDLVPTRIGRLLGYAHLRGRYEGAARNWNFIHSGEPVRDKAILDWLERVWLATIGIEAAPDLISSTAPR